MFFLLLIIISYAAVSIYVQVFVWTCVSVILGTYLGMELLSRMVNSCLTFRGIAKLFSKVCFHLLSNTSYFVFLILGVLMGEVK